ncbi:phospholipid phosphatase 1-like isoform X2 [Linepithema humile]|uniref:phospholipid phosphatase 1-like isoform X2 n=2 Tax=Linepithema humile TaxID=83485 RepID=UPI00062308D4|nr:PREDICTED: lipid phosphate phosphohydrolase 1-like isoform X2 [Linepithema humile]
MQRSTEELTKCSTITLSEEIADNTGAATTTHTEKIMGVCRKIIRLIYVLDLVLALSVILLVALLELNVLPHQQIGFFCNDPKLSFKFTGDTISMGLLISGTALMPIIVMGIAEYVCHLTNSYENVPGRSGSTRNRQIWRWYSDYTVGILTLTLLCAIMKILIGEPRPHFFDTCKPHEANNCTDEYINSYTCTNTKTSYFYIQDSSKSFPSGHSALSVYTSIFLVWYLQIRMPNRTLFLKPWLQCLVAMWGVTCSMTRVSDNRHHWWDVLAGDVLGFLFSLFVVTVPCRLFHLDCAAATVSATHTLNETLENGQIGENGFDKQRKQNTKLLSPAVVDISEAREMKDITTTWRE